MVKCRLKSLEGLVYGTLRVCYGKLPLLIIRYMQLRKYIGNSFAMVSSPEIVRLPGTQITRDFCLSAPGPTGAEGPQRVLLAFNPK